jgi:hypothetical protein
MEDRVPKGKESAALAKYLYTLHHVLDRIRRPRRASDPVEIIQGRKRLYSPIGLKRRRKCNEEFLNSMPFAASQYWS